MFTQSRRLAATGTMPAVNLMTACATIAPVSIAVCPILAFPTQPSQGLALKELRWETKPASPGGPSHPS